MTIDDQKAALRLVAKKRRQEARIAAGDGVEGKLAGFLTQRADDMHIMEGAVVAGYWAMADEIDVIPALERLSTDRGVHCALPVVAKSDAPLIFRSWQPGDVLDAGGFGTHHPVETAKQVTPDVLLVPLLAFDMAGYRMGWGGGFYDRTLEQLRQRAGTVCAIGVGYAGQEFDVVVRDRYDQPLDWIVTEQWARKVGA